MPFAQATKQGGASVQQERQNQLELEEKMKAKCDVSKSAGSGTPAWPRCLAPHCQSLEYLLTLGNLDRRPGRRSGKKPSGPSRRRPQTRLYGVGRRVPWSQTRLEENESRELHYSVENTTDDSLSPHVT